MLLVMIFIKMYIIKDERSLQLSKECTKLLKMLQNHSQNPWEALESELRHAIGLIMSLRDWAFIPSAQSLLVCGLPSLLVIEGNVSGKAASVWEQFSGVGVYCEVLWESWDVCSCTCVMVYFVFPLNSYVETLTPNISECYFIWR